MVLRSTLQTRAVQSGWNSSSSLQEKNIYWVWLLLAEGRARNSKHLLLPTATTVAYTICVHPAISGPPSSLLKRSCVFCRFYVLVVGTFAFPSFSLNNVAPLGLIVYHWSIDPPRTRQYFFSHHPFVCMLKLSALQRDCNLTAKTL